MASNNPKLLSHSSVVHKFKYYVAASLFRVSNTWNKGAGRICDFTGGSRSSSKLSGYWLISVSSSRRTEVLYFCFVGVFSFFLALYQRLLSAAMGSPHFSANGLVKHGSLHLQSQKENLSLWLAIWGIIYHNIIMKWLSCHNQSLTHTQRKGVYTGHTPGNRKVEIIWVLHHSHIKSSICTFKYLVGYLQEGILIGIKFAIYIQYYNSKIWVEHNV